jgi:tetratricopeptide (TPR) repeat protein
VAKALQEHSALGVPGEESFYEHVHLTFRGNYLVAEAVYGRVESVLQGRYGDGQPTGPTPTQQRCAERLVYSEWSRRQSLDTIVNQFLAKPPFTNQLYHQQRVASLQQRLDALKEHLTVESLEEIAERYRTAIEQAPDDWRLYWDYGKLLAEDLKQYDAAATQYRTVQSLLPHSYTGHDALASVFRGKGDLRDAVAEYRKVVAMRPTAGRPHYYLGWCYQKQGRTELAASHYRKAIRLSPNVVSAYINLGELLFKQGQLDEAARVCRAGLAVAPNHALLHCNLGMLLIQMGQRQQGTKEILMARQLDPNSPGVRRIAERLLGPQAIR